VNRALPAKVRRVQAQWATVVAAREISALSAVGHRCSGVILAKDRHLRNPRDPEPGHNQGVRMSDFEFAVPVKPHLGRKDGVT
jgi:hypothetical protein